MLPSKNKIDADDTCIKKLLKGEKYTIDYFQREYRWKEKHMKILIEDLTSAFFRSHTDTAKRADVKHYQTYYLGPVVFSDGHGGRKSIIDGQQRLTSLTLLLIYLHHLQKNNSNQVNVSELIFSEQYGEKSFNMADESRNDCLRSLFDNGDYKIKDTDDETIRNIVDRYEDIEEYFPTDEVAEGVLPYFIDWLIENVILVEIIATTDENAYTIFESMNDRGLNLTPTEMLKGYILSKINDSNKRIEINDLWRDKIQKLHDLGDNVDQSFFQAWFRGKYAKTMRPGKAGAENQDFELIGSRFHNWFKDNQTTIFELKTSDDIYNFFKFEFPFYAEWYIKIKNFQKKYNSRTPHLNYINFYGIAESLQDPMLLAAIKFGDDESVGLEKVDLAARYIETFTVRRGVNFKKFGQTAIKYTMFNVIKEIRNNDIEDLKRNLSLEITKISETWDGIMNFRLHGMNRKFVKHLLSRVTSYLDQIIGCDTTYVSYHHPVGRQYEIEHIWADKYVRYKDEFEQKDEFGIWRNKIGALLLLPQGTNQSFSDDRYEVKRQHYIKQNILAQSLHPDCYIKNPNFTNNDTIKSFGFKFHDEFKKADVVTRQKLFKKICEKIWSPNL